MYNFINLARQRWVIPKNRHTYDPSMIPPEWHSWLHYTDDRIPSERTLPSYPWMLPSTQNQTGTRAAFKTYSTVPPLIEQWKPK